MEKLRRVGSSIAQAKKEGTRKSFPDRTKDQTMASVVQSPRSSKTSNNNSEQDPEKTPTTTPSSPPGFPSYGRSPVQLHEIWANWSEVLRKDQTGPLISKNKTLQL